MISRDERRRFRFSDKYLFPAVGVAAGVLSFTALYLVWPVAVVGPALGEDVGIRRESTGADAGAKPVQDVKAVTSNETISVFWSNAPGTEADSYRVEATPADEELESRRCITETRSCVIEGLTNGAAYVVEVRSESADGTLSAPQRITGTPHPDVLTSESSALWLDADDQSTLGGAATLEPGSPVQEWRDKSGHGRVVIQSDAAAQPLVTVLGERRALKFDGNQTMSFDGSGLPDGSTASTIFAVVRLDDPDAANSCFAHVLAWGAQEAGAARIVHKGCETSMAYVETFDTHQTMQPTEPWPEGEIAFLSAVINESGIEVRMNGTSSYSWLTPDDVTIDTARGQPFVVGGAQWWGNTAGWRGLICEVAIIAEEVSSAEYQQVEQYLARKWSNSTKSGVSPPPESSDSPALESSDSPAPESSGRP